MDNRICWNERKEKLLNSITLFGLGLHLSKLNKDNYELYQRVLVETRNFDRIKTENLIQSIKNNSMKKLKNNF